VETVNDKDCYLANFWRALQADPEAVAHWADAPVNEADLHARHQWLVNQTDVHRTDESRAGALRRADRGLVGVGPVPLDRLGLVRVGRRAGQDAEPDGRHTATVPA
jgi:hypothetical protein